MSVSVLLTLLGELMVGMEGDCFGMGWNHNDRQTDVHVCQCRVTEVYYWDNVLAPGVIPFA